MELKKNWRSHFGSNDKVASTHGKKLMSNIYISNKIFEPKTFNAFTLKDYRSLTDAEKNKYVSILNAAMRTAIPEILCGGPETELIALDIENVRLGGMDDDQIVAFLTKYREEAPLRTTVTDFIGAGSVRFALFNGSNLIGSVIITQTSIINRIGSTIEVKITPLLHRTGVRVLNVARTDITAAFIQDQASLIRYVLNNTFSVVDSSFVVKPILVNWHPRNTRFETMTAVINADAALDAIIATYSEITTVPGAEGARPYNLYKHI